MFSTVTPAQVPLPVLPPPVGPPSIVATLRDHEVTPRGQVVMRLPRSANKAQRRTWAEQRQEAAFWRAKTMIALTCACPDLRFHAPRRPLWAACSVAVVRHALRPEDA